MNAPRASAEDYIQFLIATPKVASATEAGRAQPERPNAPAHDAFIRLLHRLEPDPAVLWDEARPAVKPGGALVLDDSVLDKPFARHMGLVRRCWSGRHRRVVAGIGLVTLPWTDGAALLPCDYRLADPVADETKNDHFRAMLAVAKGRGLSPQTVLFDTWYSGKDNLKAVRAHGWHFLTRVRSNRRVNPDRTGNRAIEGCDIAATGTVVHLEGSGWSRRSGSPPVMAARSTGSSPSTTLFELRKGLHARDIARWHIDQTLEIVGVRESRPPRTCVKRRPVRIALGVRDGRSSNLSVSRAR